MPANLTGFIMRHRRFGGDNLTPIWIIIIVNLLVFIATLAYSRIINLFALQGITFLSHPWTIITSMFTHIGLWHILVNMLSLYFLGSFLLRLIGEKKFLLVYFCGGILGGIFFVLISPTSIGVGASGAIFALGGALVALVPNQRVFIFPIPVPMPLWIAIIGNFVIITLIAIPTNLAVAWQAHLGGLVFGLVSGYFFRKRTRVLY